MDRPAAVVTPAWDAWLAGGLSLVFFLPFFVLEPGTPLFFYASTGAVFSVLLNWPHFSASYFLLYRDRARMKRHPIASFVMPAVLLLVVIAVLASAHASRMPMNALLFVGGVYTSVHYMGQAWGMMAAHAGLTGTPFVPAERRLLLGNLYALILFHVAYTLGSASLPGAPVWLTDGIATLVPIGKAAAVVGVIAGLVGWSRHIKRVGKLPVLRVLLPWLAMHVWLAAMARDPSAIFWVQMAHAVQYLSFPARVEVNRWRSTSPTTSPALVAVGFLAVVVAIGGALFYALGEAATYTLGLAGLAAAAATAPHAINSALNIHHYFIDGAIWKLREPQVRKELFAHLHE